MLPNTTGAQVEAFLDWPSQELEGSDEASEMMRDLTRDGPGGGLMGMAGLDDGDRLWGMGLRGGSKGYGSDDGMAPLATRRSRRQAGARVQVKPPSDPSAGLDRGAGVW